MSTSARRMEMLHYYAKAISPRYAALQALCTFDSQRAIRTGQPFCRSVYARKDQWVQKFLRREFAPLIERWANMVGTSRHELFHDAHGPIWVLWLQGEERLPELARACIARMRSFSAGHPVCVVDRASLRDLVEIPPSFYERFDKGQISAAAFSDISRVWLLARYGGVWLDSSVLMTQPLPSAVWESRSWSGKGLEPSRLEPVCIDITEWQGYFWRSGPGDQLVPFIREFFEEYLDRYERFVDYLLLNHVAKIGRELIPSIAREHATVPLNNPLCQVLGGAMENGIANSQDLRARFVDGDSFLYKLSNRAFYPNRDPQGRSTLAAELLGSDFGSEHSE